MDRLPPELVLHFLKYLDPADLVSLQCVSRRFTRLARDSDVWRTKCFDQSEAHKLFVAKGGWWGQQQHREKRSSSISRLHGHRSRYAEEDLRRHGGIVDAVLREAHGQTVALTSAAGASAGPIAASSTAGAAAGSSTHARPSSSHASSSSAAPAAAAATSIGSASAYSIPWGRRTIFDRPGPARAAAAAAAGPAPPPAAKDNPGSKRPRREDLDKDDAEWTRALKKWDCTVPGERIDWYADFVARMTVPSFGYLQQPLGLAPPRRGAFLGRGFDEDNPHDPCCPAQSFYTFREHHHQYHDVRGHPKNMPGEVRGVATFESEAGVHKVVAPINDGSLCIWDISRASNTAGGRGHGNALGAISARSLPGILGGLPGDYDYRMPNTAAVECISVDAARHTAYVAVDKHLRAVDLNTLRVSSTQEYPSTITALSAIASAREPLTVGTKGSLHVYDPRKPQDWHDVAASATLSDPKPLSILHIPIGGSGGGGTPDATSGSIVVGGRFPSILVYDRRAFPRLRTSIYSGVSLSSMTYVPGTYPYPVSYDPFGDEYVYSSGPKTGLAKGGGATIVAVGAYKGMGSLELHKLEPSTEAEIQQQQQQQQQPQQEEPMPTGKRSKPRTIGSRSKLLSVALHGSRIVAVDGVGVVRWYERDGTTVVREWGDDESGANNGGGGGNSRTTGRSSNSNSDHRDRDRRNREYAEHLIPDYLQRMSNLSMSSQYQPGHQRSIYGRHYNNNGGGGDSYHSINNNGNKGRDMVRKLLPVPGSGGVDGTSSSSLFASSLGGGTSSSSSSGPDEILVWTGDRLGLLKSSPRPRFSWDIERDRALPGEDEDGDEDLDDELMDFAVAAAVASKRGSAAGGAPAEAPAVSLADLSDRQQDRLRSLAMRLALEGEASEIQFMRRLGFSN